MHFIKILLEELYKYMILVGADDFVDMFVKLIPSFYRINNFSYVADFVTNTESWNQWYNLHYWPIKYTKTKKYFYVIPFII